jgi:hypothetical protein
VTLDSLLSNYLIPGGVYYSEFNYLTEVPGTQYSYANMNIVLLAHLLENITGISFNEYCRDSLFTPLDMDKTAWFLSEVNTDNLARRNGNLDHYGYSDYPANMLKSNTQELLRFVKAYMQGGVLNDTRILESSTVDLMTTLANPELDEYQALFWQTGQIQFGPLPPYKTVWHSGGAEGVRTLIAYSVDEADQIGLAFLTNGDSDEGRWEITELMVLYGILYNNVYAHNVSLNTSYMQAAVDSLILHCQFTNEDMYNFSPQAYITGLNNTYLDSLDLYDDGIHGDLQADDGIWGNYILPIAQSNVFQIDINTHNHDLDKDITIIDQAAFTTLQAPQYDHLVYHPWYDTTFHGGNQIKFKMFLHNPSSTDTLVGIEARLHSTTAHIVLGEALFGFPDMLPGATAESFGYFDIYISPDVFPDTTIYLPISLLSHDYTLWQDSLQIDVISAIGDDPFSGMPTVFALEQNYPNPFNPRTTIQYQLPKSSQVNLSIYNLLGQKVATLVNERQQSGYYQATWDVSDFPLIASGIYFYRLQTDHGFNTTKKLVLIK